MIQRATRFSGAFARVRQERDQILDRWLIGVIVLKEAGFIDFLNRSAEVFLQRKDGLYLAGPGISAVN